MLTLHNITILIFMEIHVLETSFRKSHTFCVYRPTHGFIGVSVQLERVVVLLHQKLIQLLLFLLLLKILLHYLNLQLLSN